MRTSPIQRVRDGLLPFARGIAGRSAYHAHRKLSVVIVIDQFRGDYLERYGDQFGGGGLGMFLDHSKPHSPKGGWHLTAGPIPYGLGSTSGNDHCSCETHAPAFCAFIVHRGAYRGHAERVDLAVILVGTGSNSPDNPSRRVPSPTVARTEASLHLGDEQGPGGSKHLQTASRKLPQGGN